jgi:glycosyltransferase involved in cell wall biosynthesis
MTSLSVVIPTRDRPELLRECLLTLVGQLDATKLEVVVVDDGSRIPLAESLSGEPFEGVDVRFDRQLPKGLNDARNRGVEVAVAPLIAFLDDDTLVGAGWAHALLDAFSQTGCDAVGGRIELQFEGSVPPWLRPSLHGYLSEFDHGDEAAWLDAESVPVGANCAVRRTAWEQAGGFRTGLDRSGSSLVSNGDTEFFRRLLSGGHGIRYEPRATVRLTLEFFRRRARAQGISDQMLVQINETIPVERQLLRELWRAGRALPILMRGLVQRRGPTVALLWIAYCRGRLATVRRARES